MALAPRPELTPPPHPAPVLSPAEQAAQQDQALIHRFLLAGPGHVDPNGGHYPDANVADLSILLDAPAGKYGFLSTGADGHFHWANGKRARFWGICISLRSIPISHQEIARVADVLERAGCNLVRFEALDNTGGILSGSRTESQPLNETILDSLDFWIACLRARGIYYYLDLLDFRTFLRSEGVVNAEALGARARPYAIFDPRLIQLQQQYAGDLLGRVNPYTHLRPLDDPALVMVELVNEHGMFIDVTGLHQLARPYEDELTRLWNQWLLRHYATRDALAAHWNAAGVPLADAEDPAHNTVVFQPMPPSESNYDRGGVRSARIRDQVDFLVDLQRAYFTTMRDYLRKLGLKCPITAAVSSVVGPDVLSVADTLDCTTENFYADHPKHVGDNDHGDNWGGDPYYDLTNPVRSSGPYAVAPQIAVLRWNNKPVVVREWCTAWPNPYRATALPDMAAYASLQDLDMVLLFTYVAGPQTEMLQDFSVQSDPTLWGLFGEGADIFLNGLVAPAKYHVDLVYGQFDLEHWGPYLNQLHRLAWCSQVRNVVDGATAPPDPGISVVSGRGGWTTPPKDNSLLFQRLDAVPPADRFYAAEEMLKSNHVPLDVSPINDPTFRFDGILYSPGETLTLRTEAGFQVDDVRHAGYVPVGVDPVGQMAFGAYNPQHHVLIFPLLSASEALRASLDLLHTVGADVTPGQMEADRWHSDTGEITRDAGAGRLVVGAPRCAMIAGEFTPGAEMEAGAISLTTVNPDGALMMVTFDGQPLPSSKSWMLKMVTHASNTGQVIDPAKDRDSAPAAFVLRKTGSAPLITGGAPTTQPTVVGVNHYPVLTINMTGGVWEMDRLGDHDAFYCDTPGIRFQVPGQHQFVAFRADGSRQVLAANPDGSLDYPAGALCVQILAPPPVQPAAARPMVSAAAHPVSPAPAPAARR